jgi:geranylgeranyl diphosphate synthase type II
LESGGKRIRALLCLTSFEMFGGQYEEIEPFLVAIEYIHTYSLIHDDLPDMDDSSMRRGKPSNHKRFGEAMAILAGDALLTDAFQLMSRSILPAEKVLLTIQRIAVAAGSAGMVGGQALDMTIDSSQSNLEDIAKMQFLKTAALIEASTISGGILGQAEPRELSLLETFGKKIGQAFQMADDLLDLETATFSGKDSGLDQKNNKPTMLRQLGVLETKLRCKSLFTEALGALSELAKPTELMVALAESMIERKS